MHDLAIKVEGLSKEYRIGEQRTSYKTLRDTLSAPFKGKGVRAFFGRKNGNGNGNSSGRDRFWALKDISFEVKPGEAVGIIGRNGAGKSTLLKILSRITEPTEGYADIRGRVGSLLEVGTGFHPELTGRENIYLNGAILGMKRADIGRQFDEMVAFAEVEKFIDTPVRHYSSGMYLRLAFAVAAHLEPEILLVDEVLAVGDMRFQKKCLGKMEDVASKGRTVLFVSHNLGAIKELCRTCIVLSDGSIDYHGPVAKALIHYSQSLTSQDATGSPREGWRQVFIDGQTNGLPKPIPNEEPFAIEATLELSEDLLKARLYCIVDDSNGNPVIHHFIDYEHGEMTSLKAGYHRVRVEFPPLWLVPDAYTVHFKLVGHKASGESDRRLSERVLLDMTDLTGQTAGKIRAVLTPPLKWSLSSQ